MKTLTKDCIEWVKEFFAKLNKTKAVVGISGGKDSSVVAAILVQALGKENVIGVTMPNGKQKDIKDSYEVINHLGIQHREVNIKNAFEELALLTGAVKSEVAITNLPARLRMATLYAIAQTEDALVANTCNLSEDYAPGGYATLFGDNAGSFAPIQDLTVTEIIEIGEDLELPYHLIHKTPVDGLQPLTDEEKISAQTGIENWTYARFDKLIRCKEHDFTEKEVEILKAGALSGKFKRDIVQIPKFISGFKNYFEDKE